MESCVSVGSTVLRAKKNVLAASPGKTWDRSLRANYAGVAHPHTPGSLVAQALLVKGEALVSRPRPSLYVKPGGPPGALVVKGVAEAKMREPENGHFRLH